MRRTFSFGVTPPCPPYQNPCYASAHVVGWTISFSILKVSLAPTPLKLQNCNHTLSKHSNLFCENRFLSNANQSPVFTEKSFSIENQQFFQPFWENRLLKRLNSSTIAGMPKVWLVDQLQLAIYREQKNKGLEQIKNFLGGGRLQLQHLEN